MSMEMTQHYQQALEQLTQDHANAWLTAWRQQGLDSFEQLGFPTLRHEAWKYTKVAQLAKKAFAAAKPIKISAEHIAQYKIADAYTLVFVNGYFDADLSDQTLLKNPAVSVQNIAQAFGQDDQVLQTTLNQQSVAPHGFLALNQALASDGLYLQIHKDAKLDKPIQCLIIANMVEDFQTQQLRNVIHAQFGSKVTLLEHYVTLNDSQYFTNNLNHLVVDENAKVTHIKLQQEALSAFHIANSLVTLNKFSEYHSHVFSFGGRLVRSDSEVQFTQPEGFCNLEGLYLTQKRQHMDFHTRIDHKVPHCTSRENYKGILSEHSRAVFNGKVLVHENAIKTDAQQSNKNLLLGENAEIDTKPELEIYNDDVKCAHGATVGQLDDTQLFYLRSRGLDLESAKDLLTYAFASELISNIDDKNLQTHLQQVLLSYLPQGQMLEEVSCPPC